MHEMTPPDWNHWQPTMRATLMFILDREQGRVLLIRKKRGLGAGKVNGPGGKLDPGETTTECAVRETQEELGVTPLDPVKRGELWFQFVDGLALYVDVFLATRWQGEAVETHEAVPLWTSVSAIPYDEMWADDRFWLGDLLTGTRCFVGKFLFDNDTMLTHEMAWNETAFPA